MARLVTKPRSSRHASYLAPYVRAHRAQMRGAHALLWEDRRAQRIRFEAIARNCPLAGLQILDVGCGRAELLAFLRARGVHPSRYTGLEAQPWLVRAARRKRHDNCLILKGDFVKEPSKLFVGAEVVIFSGSLNLLSSGQFYRSLALAWASTSRWLVFNFLSSPALANAPWLTWHRVSAVIAFARRHSATARVDDRYEEGDCTVVMSKL